MANGGFTFTQGISSPQQASQGGSGVGDVSDTIFKASTLIENKKREAMRQYENAQKMMREDLKTMHGFDTTVGGMGQFSGALSQIAEESRQKIRDAKDPVEAQEIIAGFREQYNIAKSRQASIADKKATFEALATATGAQSNALNEGLGVDEEYVLPEASDIALAQQAWDNPYEQGIAVINGRMMAIDPADGQLKELGDIAATLDSSMYDMQTRPIEAGAIRDWAKSQGVFKDIGFEDGMWNEERAGQLYDDNIFQTGSKEDRTEMGEWHRRQVLNTLEQRDMIQIFSDEDRKNFVNGNFDALDPEKTKKVLSMGKNIFIEESRFVKGSSTDDSATDVDFTSGVLPEGYGILNAEMELETPDVTTGDTSMSYKMASLPKAIEVEGSDFGGPAGNYDIFGFGVNPNGAQTARIVRKTKETEYSWTNDNNETGKTTSKEDAQALAGQYGTIEEEQVERTKQAETITIKQGADGQAGEVWSRIFSNNPTALNLLIQQQNAANIKIQEDLRAVNEIAKANAAFGSITPNQATRFDNQ